MFINETESCRQMSSARRWVISCCCYRHSCSWRLLSMT